MSFGIKYSSVNEIIFKIILIGDNNVGKNSIIRRYLENMFYEEKKNTYILDNIKLKIKRKNKKLTLNFWNTVGHEEYRLITANFLKGASVILVVFDITDPNSIKRLEEWKKLINGAIDTNAVIILLGNKQDLIKNNNYPVPLEKFKNLVKTFKWNYFELVSAKTNYNLNSILNKFCDDCLINLKDDFRHSVYMGSNILSIASNSKQFKKYIKYNKKKGCC